MELYWLDADSLDQRDVDAALGVLEAAREVDAPHEAATTSRILRTLITRGWDGERPLSALARDDGGRAVGWLEIIMPEWDNTHLGIVVGTVEPRFRRRGYGRAIFQAGVEKVRAAGRTMVLSEAWDSSAGASFLDAMGAERASAALQRRLDLVTLDREMIDERHAQAERAATDYELLRIVGQTPEHMAAEVSAMAAAINDAPIDGLDIEDEVFSPARLHGFEQSQVEMGRRLYRLIARHRTSGELAGHTLVGVDADRPWRGEQGDTAVVRAHRGHRLGLLLKTAMVRWLDEVEPQLRTVDTWNAASNKHMIRVNEELGCFVVAGGGEWQLHLPADKDEQVQLPQQNEGQEASATVGQATASLGAP